MDKKMIVYIVFLVLFGILFQFVITNKLKNDNIRD